jgi:hypothetical protein
MDEGMRTGRGGPCAPRHAGRLALLALGLLAALAAAPGPARADDPVYVRLYYSSWMIGRVEHSPADLTGAHTADATLAQNPRAELEAIFLRRLGLSYSRQKLIRNFFDAPGVAAGCNGPACEVSENALLQSFNFTLYARQVEHEQFNAFAGAGAGKLDYDYSANNVKQTTTDLYKGLSLTRWFFGIEYTWERIGFRLEASHMDADKSSSGQQAQVASDTQYLTLVIPLN